MKEISKGHKITVVLLGFVVIVLFPILYEHNYKNSLLDQIVMENTEESLSSTRKSRTLDIEEKIKILSATNLSENYQIVSGSMEGYATDEAIMSEITREIIRLQELGGITKCDMTHAVLEEYASYNYIDITAMEYLVSVINITIDCSDFHISLVMDADTMHIYEYYCFNKLDEYGGSVGEEEISQIVNSFKKYSEISEGLFEEAYWTNGIPFVICFKKNGVISTDATSMEF